jgi:hypothetical protein
MIIKKAISWLTQKKPRQREVQNVTFLSEPEGNEDSRFKTEFCRLFDGNEPVKKAYLTLARYAEAALPRLTLCLFCIQGADENAIVKRICALFRQKFKKSPSLDILFLTQFQEVQVHGVCEPFCTR